MDIRKIPQSWNFCDLLTAIVLYQNLSVVGSKFLTRTQVGKVDQLTDVYDGYGHGQSPSLYNKETDDSPVGLDCREPVFQIQ